MGKIYGKTGAKRVKPKKKNEHNRFRNVIINFRVSPGEKKLIDARVAASGMGKQDYYRQSCMYQKILVRGNIKTFTAIKNTIKDLYLLINKNPNLEDLEPADAERIKTILEIMRYLFGGEYNDTEII